MSSQKSTQPTPVPKPQQNGHTTQAQPGPSHGRSTADLDPFAAPNVYYGESHGPGKVAKSRTYSAVDPIGRRQAEDMVRARRQSHDVQGDIPRQYYVEVDATLNTLLAREDTDHNVQITIEDKGPKTIELGTAASAGYRRLDVRGTYMLSNLLQELTLAKMHGRTTVILDEARLNEDPVNRLSRSIKDSFWPNLTRRIDGQNIAQVASDPKFAHLPDRRPRIYVPRGAPEQYQYYSRIARQHPDMKLDVQWLKEGGADDDEYVRDLNTKPGLLAVAMTQVGHTTEGEPDFIGLPFVVPGGRFNELYGWDSYMETLGLLVNDRVDLCQSMVKHFCFCIQHYGKILNANRSYYLRRSQPPFLTDMALRVYERLEPGPESLEFLRQALLAAIKDYYGTWVSKPRHDEASGLSCYVPGGTGVPPETEASHFKIVLTPYAEKHNMTFDEFVDAYNHRRVSEPALDEYFRHDRGVRESGHDTTYRLENVAADLATVDLNSLLYKYEADIARTIRNLFGDRLEIPPEWHVKGQPTVETSSSWYRRSVKRRQTMTKLMWDEKEGMFFDYNVKEQKHTNYESATTFWAMWAGVCTPTQAVTMVTEALPKFETHGGLVSGTRKSRGEVGLHRPNRQWDYPYGWAPQQILAWTGLQRYGFEEEAQRIAYKWLCMVTKSYMDFNGVVVEKYNVVTKEGSHKVDAEYGNQGSDFKGVALEGFGWVNASYVYGLGMMTKHMIRALGNVIDWHTFKKMTAVDEEIAGGSNSIPRPTMHGLVHELLVNQQVPHHAEPAEPHSHADLERHAHYPQQQHTGSNGVHRNV